MFMRLHTLSYPHVVYAIPFVILHNLKIVRTRQKFPAFFMFGLGFLNILSAFIILIDRVSPWGRMKNFWGDFNIACTYLADFQGATAILIVCLPPARRLWLGLSPEALQTG